LEAKESMRKGYAITLDLIQHPHRDGKWKFSPIYFKVRERKGKPWKSNGGTVLDMAGREDANILGNVVCVAGPKKNRQSRVDVSEKGGEISPEKRNRMRMVS